MGQIKLVFFVMIAAFVGYSVFFSDTGEQTADLGQVLDRTEFALSSYQTYVTDKGVPEISEAEMGEFTAYYTQVLNSDPRFYENTLGLTVQEDASFLGFADTNANGTQDTDEGKLFTVEIDSENNRLIATDVAGNSSGLRFSGTGFLAGMFLGNLLSRQSGAGVKPGAFNNKTVTPRSAYKAPSSARSGRRSGGLRAGK